MSIPKFYYTIVKEINGYRFKMKLVCLCVIIILQFAFIASAFQADQIEVEKYGKKLLVKQRMKDLSFQD